MSDTRLSSRKHHKHHHLHLLLHPITFPPPQKKQHWQVQWQQRSDLGFLPGHRVCTTAAMMHLTARSPLSIRPSCSMPCCRAAAVPTPARAGSSSSNKPQWQQQLASGVLAGSLLLAPVGAADAKPQQLADLLRSEVREAWVAGGTHADDATQAAGFARSLEQHSHPLHPHHRLNNSIHCAVCIPGQQQQRRHRHAGAAAAVCQPCVAGRQRTTGASRAG